MKKLIGLCFLGLISASCHRPADFLYPVPPPAPTPGLNTPQPPPTTDCPVVNERILVIDLKSGWWGGDGGNTFAAMENFIDSKCETFNIEYGHMTTIEEYGGAANSFPSQPFSTYSEIWVLSGSSSDGEDLPVSTQLFTRFLNGIVQSSANLFLGSGFGTNLHINAITNALGLGKVVTNGAANDLVFLQGNGTDVITPKTFIQAIPAGDTLFAGVSTLPDLVAVNGTNMQPDILTMGAGLTSRLTNSSGQTEIASTTISGRQVIIDIDLPRLYLVLNSDPNVRNYIVNLTKALQK
jgi:hypothetical protein